MSDEDDQMDLIQDRFDDVSIDDAPVEDDSYFEEQQYAQEAQPTSENFQANSRYKPSLHNLRDLPTIREELHDDLRSSLGSRTNTRPPSVLSEKSHDFSSQFGAGGENAIDKFTDQFYAEENKAERLFPERELVDKGFMSPARDKQNSWEPSVCHYEKQPTPEVQNNSPGLIFANLTSQKEKPTRQKKEEIKEKGNEENVPMSSSSEKTILSTSPLSSTKCSESQQTSTPKRPGASNRFSHRLSPHFDASTICASPQRTPLAQSRLINSVYPSAQSSSSDTILSNRTISHSMVQRVMSGRNFDQDLLSALDQARKKRETKTAKPDFRLNTTHTRAQRAPSKLSVVPSATSNHPSYPSTSISESTTSQYPSQSYRPLPAGYQRTSASAVELTNSNTTNMTSNSSRLSTAKSRDDLSRRGFTNSTATTVIPNTSALTTMRDGRESVNSMGGTLSRMSSITSVNGANRATDHPLRITASRLAFGAVPVNESLTMELEIENVSDRQCRVQCSIDSTTSIYQIVDNQQTVIEPKRSSRVRVSFTPVNVGRYQVNLIVTATAQNFLKKISMWGFGGVSNIVPVSAKDLQPTAKPSEFAMYSSDITRFTFKLSNFSGLRGAFALMTVYDSAMRPVPSEYVSFYPSKGVVIKRKSEKRIEIRISKAFDAQDNYRTSSAMSTASTASSMASSRRRAFSGAEFIIEVAWGEEVFRERLRLLESKRGNRHELIDGLDFTGHRFSEEESLGKPPNGFPHICEADIGLFASSYRTLFINVFSSAQGLTAFRAATVHPLDATSSESVLETTAFRHQTFVNDATMMPSRSAK